MRAVSTKPIIIIAATLVLSAAPPRETQAAREWLWEGGRFLPLAVQPQQLDKRAQDRNQRRWNTPYRANHTPFAPRKEAGRERPPQQDKSPAQRTSVDTQQMMLARREIQKQRADLRKQQADVERREALLARKQDSLQREKAKVRQQSSALATPNHKASITCDAARAVVADFGFQGVKPEQCEGNMRFAAIRDGTKFSTEVAANGELTKVQRLP